MVAGPSCYSQPIPASVGESGWCVYLLCCQRGGSSGVHLGATIDATIINGRQCHPTVNSVIYTGISNNLEKRWAAHRSGKGAKFTRAHYPLALLAVKPGLTQQQAARLEAEVKRLPAVKKRELARAWHAQFGLPTWADTL